MRGRSLHALGIALAFLSPGMAAPAGAQAVASVSADSDDRYRGVSLSDGEPVVRATIAYDHANGAYAGGSVIEVAGGGEAQLLGYTAYAGYSAWAKAGLAWDVGVTNAHYSAPIGERYTVDFTELYAGLMSGNASGRVYVSPNYFGEGAQTVYVDLDDSVDLTRRWRLFGHLGALTALAGSTGLGGHRAYADARAGFAFEFGNGEVRLAWTTVGPRPSYPNAYPAGRAAVVLGATYGF